MFCRKCGKDIGELEKCPFCDFEEYAKKNITTNAPKGANDKKNSSKSNDESRAPFVSSTDAVKKWRKQSGIGTASHVIGIIVTAQTLVAIFLPLFIITFGQLFRGFMSKLPQILGFYSGSDPAFYEYLSGTLIPGIMWFLFVVFAILCGWTLLDNFAKLNLGKWLNKKKYNTKAIITRAIKRDRNNDVYLTVANWVGKETSGKVLMFVHTGVNFLFLCLLFLSMGNFFSKMCHDFYYGMEVLNRPELEVLKETVLSVDFFAFVFILISFGIFNIVTRTIITKKSEASLESKAK